MKRAKTAILLSLLAVCFTLMSAGILASAKEVQFAEIPNVSLDLPVEYKTLDMQGTLYPRGFDTCPDSNVSSPTTLTKTPTEDFQWLRFHEATRLTESPTADESKPGWAVIDLGEIYSITELRTQMWNDWSFIVIAQVSENADFSDAVTIFNNDTAGKWGMGTGTDGAYTDVFTDLQVLRADSPVEARYVRVLSDAKGAGYSVFSRIEVYGAKSAEPESPEDILPVYASHVSGNYAGPISVTLYSLQKNVSIYYTLDGSFPTEQNGTLYSAPVEISEPSVLRAVAVYDGAAGKVSEYTYIVPEPARYGENVAQGATVTAKDLAFEQTLQVFKFDTSTATPAEPESSSMVVDNSIDPNNSSTVLGTKDEETGKLTAAVGWVVIDFGAVYSIDTIRFNWWHDWWFADAKIELSVTEDFAEPVSVYDQAAGYQNVANSYTEISLDTAVNARYLRATNRNENGGINKSMFTEIQAIVGVGKFPAAPVERAVVSAADIGDTVVAQGTALEEVIAGLPSTIDAVLTDGTSVALAGEWTCEDYDADALSVYTFVFVLQDGQSVCDAYGLLRAAVEVVAPADKDALNEEIGLAETLTETQYTASSWVQMQEVLTRARALAEDLRALQQQVDAAVQELAAARQALVLRADVTDLKALTEQVGQVQEEEYTAGTYTAFAQALAPAEAAAAEGGNADLTQEQADALENALRQAYEQLVKRATSEQYEELSALLEDMEALAEQDDKYTLSGIAALLDAIEQYKPILSYTDEQKADTAESVLNAACDALENAVPALRGNTAALQQKYDEYLAKYGNDEADTQGYLRATWLRFIDDMAAAERACAAGGNADLTQVQVDALLEKLEAAVDGLTPYGDREALENAYEQGKALSAQDYTAQTFTEFADALADAGYILAKAEDVTAQKELDDCRTILETAKQGLVSIKELRALAAEADTKEEGACTASTYGVLFDALEKAKLVLADADAAQDEVNAAQEALQAALSGLATRGNTDELRILVEQASSCKQEEYAAADWEALTAWLNYAESVLASNEVTQADVDETVENLRNALGNTLQARENEGGCSSSAYAGFAVVSAALLLCGAALAVSKKGGKA